MIIRNFHPVRHALVCAALAAGLSVHASFANAEEITDERVVIYQESTLSNDEGAAQLYDRLQAAAREVCRGVRGRDAGSAKQYRACYDKALADAVADVNQQTLTSLHDRADAKSARENRKSDKSAS